MPLVHLEFAAVIGAKRLILVLLGMFTACLLAINGGLLIFRPDLFLKFYDLQNRGDYWGKTAAWRRDVYDTEYKILGAILFLSGLLFLGLLAMVLFEGAS